MWDGYLTQNHIKQMIMSSQYVVTKKASIVVMQNNNNILRFLTFYQIERGLRVTHVIMYAGNIIIV